MTVDIPRETALKALYEINENGAYSNIAIDKLLEAGRMDERDRAFVTELVYGVVKWQLSIDWVIRQFSNIRLKKISPWIMNILRLGAYQFLYMDKVPESAACNECAKLSARYGHKASTGFVNAVLRNIVRNRDSIRYPEKNENLIQYLSIRYSHPEWMAERFLGLFGSEFTESLLESNNSTPDLTFRANTLKISRDDLITALKNENIEAYPGKLAPEAIIVKNPSSISRLEAFKNGFFQVQDESSMLAARVLDPEPGEFIIDACSAPGGKATHIAQLMGNKGVILAGDIHEHKLKLINDSANRLALSIIRTEIRDAAAPDEKHEGKADRVLLDAPCSGLGIIRRKPDIKWVHESSDSIEIARLQAKMLKSAAACVKPGGVIVYSTCTILPEENTEIVESFLKYNTEFYLDDITGYLPDSLKVRVTDKGMLQLYPHLDGADGFFIAKLRRKD